MRRDKASAKQAAAEYQEFQNLMRSHPPRGPMTEDDLKRELLKMLADALKASTLAPGVQRILLGDLENYYFRSSKRQRAGIRRVKAQLFSEAIQHLRAAERISVADAKRKVVEIFKLQSVEALEKYIKRARREADKN